jgi:hypothetical protein
VRVLVLSVSNARISMLHFFTSYVLTMLAFQ